MEREGVFSRDLCVVFDWDGGGGGLDWMGWDGMGWDGMGNVRTCGEGFGELGYGCFGGAGLRGGRGSVVLDSCVGGKWVPVVRASLLDGDVVD